MTETVYIVTPAMNAERFIDETITSVVQQAGDFRIRYHVQDGGSTDNTLRVLEQWASRLEASHFPIRCHGVEFSFSSGPDRGMYAAINRGFAAILPEGAALMSWINADDWYSQGAFATAKAVMAGTRSPVRFWQRDMP